MKEMYMAYVGSYSYTGNAKGITVYDVDVEKGAFSYWIADVSIETLAQKRFQFSGAFLNHRTVKLGSGAGPRLYNVWR